jgi:rhodanese-related sulfurtransferase
MAPFDIVAALGKFSGYLVFLLIGMGFGAVLEMSGFGDSRKLAAQFYLKDMTVLKVMFTGIIVAMVLIFTFSSLGLLDFGRVYVNPTYLVPGIIGGLIMGVGFIIGGFCPGTSIVALATFKIDGFFFAAGVTFGVFVFGETVSIFEGFHNSTYMGRFLLPELFGVGTGVVVLAVVFMALIMFYWAEIAEKFFGEKMSWQAIRKVPPNTRKVLASAALVFISLFVLFSGQPSPEDKWNWIKAEETKKLESRDVFIHPGELLEVMNDPLLYTKLLDIRSETDYNLFHLENAVRITDEDIHNDLFMKDLLSLPASTVIVVMSNDEADAVGAYELLRGLGVLNLYVLDGGINNWLNYFPIDSSVAEKIEGDTSGEALHYVFNRAVGANVSAANPGTEDLKEIKFEKKVKMQKKKVTSGGCG